MANSQALCTSFKAELPLGAHQLGSVTIVSRTSLTAPTVDTVKAALMLKTGSLGAGTATYTSVTGSELAATGNYVTGGVTVTNANAPSASGTSMIWTPSASFAWTTLTSSGTFDCCLVYNSTQGARAISVHTFGDQTITAGNFTLSMPTNAVGTALVQIT